MKLESSAWFATEAAPARAAAPPMSSEQRVLIDCMRLFLSHWRGALIALTFVTLAAMLTGWELVPMSTWAIWGAFACTNSLCQAAVCRAMERADTLADGVRLWQPWLLSSIAINGIIWGLMPLLLSAASTPGLVFACVFNAMLMFCIANAPGTPGMVLCAAVPFGVLGAAALMLHGTLSYAGVGYAALIAVITYHGLRLQSALRTGMVLQHDAEDLALNLRTHQQRLMEVERERTLLLERQRLTRDMHDGLGSALIASLAAVERGEVRPERLAEMLRDCVDDLRAVIDSLEPINHDLVALLANLRHRLERRLDAAGVRLEWQMEDLPTLAWLGPPQALHVMRIVQEVLTNVIKHAQASHIRLMGRMAGDEVEVCIVDDGCGFDMSVASSGRGLKFLRQRADALGGKLDIATRPGHGTSVRLQLPVTP